MASTRPYMPSRPSAPCEAVEIISKVLLLANVQAIRDPSILAQIATSTRGR